MIQIQIHSGYNSPTTFSDDEEVEVYDLDPPVPRTNLVVDDLGLLEELRINFTVQYSVSGSSGGDHQTLPLLRHLYLDVPYEAEAVRWLHFTPNLTELELFVEDQFDEAERFATQPAFSSLAQIQLLHLRTIRTRAQSSTAFVLRCITCPVLQVLDLHLGTRGHATEDELYEFLQRSMPELSVLHLYFWLPNPSRWNNEPFRAERVFDSLVLVPSVVKFKVMWSPWHDAVALVRALGRTRDSCDPSAPFALLPALQTLEFYSMRVDPAHFVDLVH